MWWYVHMGWIAYVRVLHLGTHEGPDLGRLADAQVKHDLLTTTGDGVGANLTVKTFNLLTLTATRVSQTAKDLGSLTGTEFKGACRLGLANCTKNSVSIYPS